MMSGTLEVRRCSLLDVCGDVDAIAHACNCVAIHHRDLPEKAVFERFPEADACYKRRHPNNATHAPGGQTISDMGSIQCIRLKETPTVVINLMSQYYPGPVRKSFRGKDEKADRQAAFQTCLNAIAAEMPTLESIAFPYGVGCEAPTDGAAAAATAESWKEYKKMINAWAAEHPHVRVIICRARGYKRKRRPLAVDADEPLSKKAKSASLT